MTPRKTSEVSRPGPRHPLGDRLRSALVARRGEDGQALVLVLIFMMLVVLLAPIVVTQVINEDAQAGVNQNFEAALAAAEAGVQQYRNNLDLYSNYWEYNVNNLPQSPLPADPALQANGWQPVANSSPPEAFHYIPGVPTTNGTSGQVLLTVTGRAGSGPGANNYVYRTIQVEMQSAGVLTNAYFSQYEVEDPAQNTNTVCVTPPGVSTSSCSSNSFCQTNAQQDAPCLGSALYPAGSSAIPALESGKTYWQSLCQYETWGANTFVDNYSSNTASIDDPYDGGTPFNNHLEAVPPGPNPVTYYGPYRGNDPATSYPFGSTVTYQAFVNSSGQKYTASNPCSGPFVFDNGESFSGPVYTNDQLWVCSTPNFGDGLQSGITSQFTYDANWPTQNVQNGNVVSGTGGWIDDGAIDSTSPENWDNNGCGGTSSPNLHGKLSQGGSEGLPPLNSALLTAAKNNGCVYTGPTMIEFVTGGTFNVWSPLTSGSAGLSGACGTFSSTTPFQTGLTIPPNGLDLYVQSAPGNATIPPLSNYINGTTTNPAGQDPAGALPTGATCLDPWKPYAPSPCSQATEGDAIIEGELKGQVTIGASNNIVVSRDLSYQCTGGPSAQASLAYSGFPAACQASGQQDVLGLAANGDAVINHPGPQCSASQLPPGFTSTSPCDDDNTPQQTEPYEWPAITSVANPQGFCTNDGTESNPTIADVVPDCEIENPVIDAAVVSLAGSFADEDWDIGSIAAPGGGAGSAWLQGTDIGFYRGPFGCNGCAGGGTETGYNKEFSYDSRLTYLTPPDMLSIAALLWSPTTLVNCGDQNDSSAALSANGEAGATICPGINGIN